MLYGSLFLAFLILWVYCLVEAITTDESLMRNLPKVAWVFIVLLFPLIGSIMWLAVGRPSNAPLRSPRSASRPTRPPTLPADRPPIAPEDDPDWNERFRRDTGDDNG